MDSLNLGFSCLLRLRELCWSTSILYLYLGGSRASGPVSLAPYDTAVWSHHSFCKIPGLTLYLLLRKELSAATSCWLRPVFDMILTNQLS